jgi:hypothetical protein
MASDRESRKSSGDVLTPRASPRNCDPWHVHAAADLRLAAGDQRHGLCLRGRQADRQAPCQEDREGKRLAHIDLGIIKEVCPAQSPRVAQNVENHNSIALDPPARQRADLVPSAGGQSLPQTRISRTLRMNIRFQNRLIVTSMLAALVWFATGLNQSVSAQATDKLTKASECSVQGSRFHAGGTSSWTMNLKNDGGWCWTNVTYTAGKLKLSADYVTVSKDNPPKHGHIVIRDLSNFSVRIAYQPDPGFVGADSFTMHFGIVESDVTLAVTVSQ